ncbi:MAG: hypothetical protein HBSAPP03_20050 [Phycisphaerae bacterium]|nr:MAG: hypothetical protein HBSAPP03_20050 [Phycisphaerae bacterium]
MVNTTVANGPSDQGVPLLVATPDGGCYISWYHGVASGNDVRLQRLDAAGVAQFGSNGLLVADRNFSSTVGHDLMIDAAGNALLTFNDDRTGSNQICVTKVSPAGVQLWGNAGVTVSSGTLSKSNPHVAELSNGDLIVGWTENATMMFRRMGSDGTPLGAAFNVAETGHQLTVCDIQPSLNGSFIVWWTRSFTTNFMSNKALYAQRYDAAYAPLWPNTGSAPALVVYGPVSGDPWPTGSGTYPTQGGSVQIGYTPPMVPDGQGGAVFAWYENVGPRGAYLQHVLADGTMRFQLHGLPTVVTPTTRIRYSAAAAFDRDADEYFVASVEGDASPQANYRSIVQKFSGEGTRLWGAGGAEAQANSGFQQSFTTCLTDGAGGCLVFGFDGRNAASSTHVLWGTRLNSSGTPLWANFPSSVIEAKGRLAAVKSTQGFAILTFSGNRAGDPDVYAQNVTRDGALGPIAPPCDADVNCDGATNGVDVEVQELAVGGDLADYCLPDADFNLDGAVNGTDVEAVELVVGGAPCP